MSKEEKQSSFLDLGANDKKGELLRWVTFQLGNEMYGVNVMQVREVLRYTDIAPVPGCPGSSQVDVGQRFSQEEYSV